MHCMLKSYTKAEMLCRKNIELWEKLYGRNNFGIVKHMLQVRGKGKAYNKGPGNVWCKVESRSNLGDAVQKEHREHCKRSCMIATTLALSSTCCR